MEDLNMAGCYDCGLPYSDVGWIEAVIPNKIWEAISPTGDGGGLLCITCMNRRLKKMGFENVPVQLRGTEALKMDEKKESTNIMNKKRKYLEHLLQKHALKFDTLILSSGKVSNYYIDCRRISTLKEGAPLLADLIKEKIGNLQVDAIGGPEIGAIPILGALSGKGYFNTFIIRKGLKKYGLNKLIEGQLNEQDSSVIIIDDVATTGKSILRAINTVKKVHPNIKILKVIVIVDREEEAKEYLKEFGYNLEHIFTSKELIGELNG